MMRQRFDAPYFLRLPFIMSQLDGPHFVEWIPFRQFYRKVKFRQNTARSFCQCCEPKDNSHWLTKNRDSDNICFYHPYNLLQSMKL